MYLVVGLPKSGTTSLAAYFACGGLRASHQLCGEAPCAWRVRDNLRRGRPALAGCGPYDAHTQLDWEFSDARWPFCFFPQRHLAALRRSAPASTFVLNVRDARRWAGSVAAWGTLRHRLARCNLTAHDLRDDAQLAAFYEAHSAAVRAFARRTGHRLVEVDIERNVSALARATGIPAACYGRHNARAARAGPPARTCYVGDSLLRHLWCHARGVAAANCTGHRDRADDGGAFYWRPTLRDVGATRYPGCARIVWDNLFHEVRASPAQFRDAPARRAALARARAHLLADAPRVVWYVAQRPTPPFADEAHGGVRMLDAWRADRALADGVPWARVRADVYTERHGRAADGRHYDAATLAALHAQLVRALA